MSNETVMNLKCPICGTVAIPDNHHPEADLFYCSQCSHRFSHIKAGVPTEPYDSAYFEVTHRNWFAHPDLPLFDRIARIVDHEPEPRSLIDVGCGNGNFLRFLAARPGSAGTLVGADLIANPPTPGIEFIQADIFATNLDRQFSVVTTLATIEHIEEVRTFCQRLKALAKPGGLVVVMTINENSLFYIIARLLRRIGLSLPFNRLYGRHHVNHFSRKSLWRALENEGLQPIQVFLTNPPFAAMDVPASGPFSMALMRAAVGVLLILSKLINRPFLQTVVCRRGE
jgi:2-polyprenyl-3-methyl-5-hydroxy-6-metoxy-1,4-benzoquinol methylase